MCHNLTIHEGEFKTKKPRRANPPPTPFSLSFFLKKKFEGGEWRLPRGEGILLMDACIFFTVLTMKFRTPDYKT